MKIRLLRTLVTLLFACKDVVTQATGTSTDEEETLHSKIDEIITRVDSLINKGVQDEVTNSN